MTLFRIRVALVPGFAEILHHEALQQRNVELAGKVRMVAVWRNLFYSTCEITASALFSTLYVTPYVSPGIAGLGATLTVFAGGVTTSIAFKLFEATISLPQVDGANVPIPQV